VSLVIRAQAEDEPVAWIEPEDGSLYPPDLADSGVDLDALVVVRVPSEPYDLARAAELLLRSGAFGLVVLDLTGGAPRGDAWQGRLSALSRQHGCRVVLLSEAEDESASLGAMVGLRVSPARERRAPGHYVVEHRVLKDKLGGGGGALAADRRRAPWGLS
jgi:recombination protein RecA